MIAPSNPAVSIDPVLAVGGVRDVLARRRDDVVAVSPIIGGKALKGPADRLLVELGREASAVAVAEWYADVVGTLIIDTADADLAPAIEALGVPLHDKVGPDGAAAVFLCEGAACRVW